MGSATALVTLTTSWQKVTVIYTTVSPGSSTRDFNAHVSSLGPSASFYADEVWITASWPWRDAHRVAYLTYGP